jgi:hypothetical protein
VNRLNPEFVQIIQIYLWRQVILMAYLIPTDWKNLHKTLKHGIIRIPQTLRVRYDLRRIKKDDMIFLFDHENGKIYGPLFPGYGVVMEEKNPRTGPFNGTGRAENHYLYDCLKVDCSGMWKKGVGVKEMRIPVDVEKFFIPSNEESIINEALRAVNEGLQSLVINFQIDFKSRGNRVNATVVEVSSGMTISSHKFDLPESFFRFINWKKRAVEDFSTRADWMGVERALKELGRFIYENIFNPIGLGDIFQSSGCSIYISGDERCTSIPIEIAFRESFIFENNILAFRGERKRENRAAPIRKILIFADPAGCYSWAYNEGMVLYEFFRKKGCSVDFISRPLTVEILIDLFSFYDIIHFSGHSGSINSSNQGKNGGEEIESIWNLGWHSFKVPDIGMQRKMPHLVFSSTCGNTLKMGFSFLRLGVLNCMGSRWTIPDRDMSGFLLNFYSLLFERYEIGFAFQKSVLSSYRRGDVLPALFVLQGEPRTRYEFQGT